MRRIKKIDKRRRFTDEQELEIINKIKYLGEKGHLVNKNIIMKFAQELDSSNVSKKWYLNFKKRHKIVKRMGSTITISRINADNINSEYSFLSFVVSIIKIYPELALPENADQWLNSDETGFSMRDMCKFTFSFKGKNI